MRSLWEEDFMPRQRTLDFGGEKLGALWKRFPERCRREAMAAWARVIALAAQATTKEKKGGSR